MSAVLPVARLLLACLKTAWISANNELAGAFRLINQNISRGTLSKLGVFLNSDGVSQPGWF